MTPMADFSSFLEKTWDYPRHFLYRLIQLALKCLCQVLKTYRVERRIQDVYLTVHKARCVTVGIELTVAHYIYYGLKIKLRFLSDS